MPAKSTDKLAKQTLPKKHSWNDFECFGPVAKRNTKFDGTYMADMGCFTQDGKDSNKYYFCCVAKSTKTGLYHVYVEYGREGENRSSYQFFRGTDKVNAQKWYQDQYNAKNTRRGEWKEVGSVKVFRPKIDKNGKPKDLYIIRELSSRQVNIPVACNICNVGAAPVVGSTSSYDRDTLSLLSDISNGTTSYAKSSMVGGKVPSIGNIAYAREIITEAENLVSQNKDTNDLTEALYSLIPKRKAKGVDNYRLGSNNIFTWRQDLDAFEAANTAQDVSGNNFNLMMDLEYLNPRSKSRKDIVKWLTGATRNRHGYISGRIKIKNIWKVTTPYDLNPKIDLRQADALVPRHQNGAPFQDDSSNTRTLIHGTRSVNVFGLLSSNFILPNRLSGVSTNGAMFGPGIYFADDWKKSVGYTSHGRAYWGGGGEVRNRSNFFFLCDVVLGNVFVAPRARGYKKPPKTFDSVFGKAGHTGAWGGSLQNNEFVVYDSNRQKMSYLIEFDC